MIKRIAYLTFLISLWLGGMSISAVVKSSLITLVVTYVILPMIYHFSPSIQRHLIFLTFVNYPWKVNFEEPEHEGLPGTRNFYLQTESNVSVGVWHILPGSLVEEAPLRSSPDYNEWFDNSLSDGRPVCLYLHGNTSSRAVGHRIELYKMLRELDWHVVTFDYRGYADSSKVLVTEDGIVHDAKFVYRYVYNLSKKQPPYVWGHSLGTGVSCHAIGDLCIEGKPPSCLILESPFSNIYDEVTYHPLTAIYRKMPKFRWFFLSTLKKNGIEFKSDEHIGNVCAPILFLHAKDDLVVPYHLGLKLFNSATQSNEKTLKREFISFESDHHFGHKYICRAPELPQLLMDFLAKIRE